MSMGNTETETNKKETERLVGLNRSLKQNLTFSEQRSDNNCHYFALENIKLYEQ